MDPMAYKIQWGYEAATLQFHNAYPQENHDVASYTNSCMIFFIKRMFETKTNVHNSLVDSINSTDIKWNESEIPSNKSTE